MDALEFPVTVAVSAKIMRTEGFARVKVKDGRDSDRVSILVNPSIDRCCSSLTHKDGTLAANVSGSASRNQMPHDEPCEHSSQPNGFHGEIKSHGPSHGGLLPSVPRTEAKQLQRKAGKLSRNSSGCSKRLRTAQVEDFVSQPGADNVECLPDQLGSSSSISTLPERIPVVKQKSNLNGKRSEKRNFKVPAKTRFDSFSMKTGLGSFSSATGGNNILGTYGLKSDIHDVTKLVDEISLDDLLAGSFKHSSLGKDKGKTGTNSNDSMLNSVKNASSLLQLRHMRSSNSAETDVGFNSKMPMGLLSSGLSVPDLTDADKEFTSAADGEKNQETCSKTESLADMNDSQLCQPKDVLERLALSVPKDLEVLLQDTSKPSASLRYSPDARTGKIISHRASLPPFPWSHAFGGHFKSSSDSVKLSTSRSTCLGRWMRVGNTATSLGAVTNSYSDLESLSYDHSLVPIKGSVIKIVASRALAGAPWHPQESSLSVTCSLASHITSDRDSPRLLAAAQTLVDIAQQTLKQNLDDMIKWPKKLSQKAMKARKAKSIDKLEGQLASSNSTIGSADVVHRSDQIFPLKRPKLLTMERRKDIGHMNNIKNGPINWSAPRSSRSSPLKSVREVESETKFSTPNIIKQAYMMTSSSRVSDKPSNSRQHQRKLVPTDWNRS
ncbi:hypothetical protein RJ641_001315 [Dillenia turbinata]|uniref:Uncharacterized protein n=1 Tax=Dillenia turbinata TaxID=194707 RepID=A0AAN8WG86_9MAGN